jgi:hypothetical protein
MSEAAPAGASKPVDLGNGAVCASFGSDGSWLSVGTTHPVHGFVELNALPPFDESRRGDPDATRAYRALMVLDDHAVLRIELDRVPLGSLRQDLRDPARPRWTGHVAGVEVAVEAAAADATLHQRWTIREKGARRPRVTLRLRGSLDRPTLAEITELDPPAPTGARTSLDLAGPIARLRAPSLPAAASFELVGIAYGWIDRGGNVAEMTLGWPADAGELTFDVRASLEPGQGPIRPPDRPAAPASPSTGGDGPDRLMRSALAYVRGCTTLWAASDERAILTDHRLLPLSWTRDAYYQALLLLAADGPGDRDRVADHLRWLWRANERPDGRWVRSHHANGRRKDLAFQADQQLYPILELADFWRLTGALPEDVEWSAAIATAWEAALLEVDSEVGLIQTAENSADDPAVAPFIGASQILLWYAAARLAELCVAGAVQLDPDGLLAVAQRTRREFDSQLRDGSRWAYATDGRGRRLAYHDANDLPTALAPVWGFCSPDDPGWRATMAFAFSPANPGFCEGPLAGLGSAHTRGAWALGDVQAWLVARLIGDEAAAGRAIERLLAVAFDDGMLPEAYTASGDDERIERVRHWFAWPGAAFGGFWLLAERGDLMERLRAD